jgi:hypothetical protein
MDSTRELPLERPHAGQQFVDASGRQWVVKDVCDFGQQAAPSYYVLRMAFKSPDTLPATFRMSSQEYLSMAARGGLKPMREARATARRRAG